MTIFNFDLDNTIIYSYKHNIGQDKINVEIYGEQEISYVTVITRELLKKISEKIIIIPTTTRTQEQYERINLNIGNLKYALICNGGILLEDGVRSKRWLEESKMLIKDSRQELLKSQLFLEEDINRYFEVRYIEELFVFTKCHNPEFVVDNLKKILNTKTVNIFNNGEKIYVVPKNLDKGTAVRRFKEYIGADKTIASGDSEFDVSMVCEADIGIVPNGFMKTYNIDKGVLEVKGNRVFSEEMLLEVSRILEKENCY